MWVLLEIVLVSGFLWTMVLLFIWFDPDLRRRWALEAELLERPAVSDDEFVRRFFPDAEIPAEVLVTVRHMLAEELDYPVAQLFADDYFKHFWDEWAADSLIKALERKFGIVIRKKRCASHTGHRSPSVGNGTTTSSRAKRIDKLGVLLNVYPQ